jgi:tRNA threonylcarbamoyladenosine biosynthesis protein TsaB
VNLILHIDTAVDAASICLSDGDVVIAEKSNAQARESAAWLQPAIKQLLADCNQSLQQLKAVSVSAGPGSYTGLRVGMASAKGLCYALQIPLITVGTLEVMTAAALQTVSANMLFCPLIDARRMEVFTAMYNRNMQCVLQPQNMVLNEESFEYWLQQGPICFFGNGSIKLRDILKHDAAHFAAVQHSAVHLVLLACNKYRAGAFSDLAYAEPLYIKAFYTTQQRI